ncbi:MAG: S8 family serine peptidase [Dehalococcoidia bacterium]
MAIAIIAGAGAPRDGPRGAVAGEPPGDDAPTFVPPPRTLPPRLIPAGAAPAEGLSPRLDRLHRIDLIGRAGGRAVTDAIIPQLPADLRAAVASRELRITGDTVQVYVEAEAGVATITPALSARGFVLERTSEDDQIAQGALPIRNLAAAAALDGVRLVRPPHYAGLEVGSAMTAGDAILNANDLRATFGTNGAGVKVGVISDGLEGLATAQTSGDLPVTLDYTTCDMVASGEPDTPTDPDAGAEGTALLEIVHDVAPGAELWFGYFGINSPSAGTALDFQAAVDCLADHVDVLIDDLSFFNAGPYDGTSSISQNASTELNDASNPLRAYTRSGGNRAHQHYQETFEDSGFVLTDSITDWNIHEFQSTATTTDGGQGLPCEQGSPVFCADTIFLAPDGGFTIFLQWDDGWGTSGNNYDLFLFEELSQAWVTSEFIQDGNDFPFEQVSWFNFTGTTQILDIFIASREGAAAPRTFDVFMPCVGCLSIAGNVHNFNTISSSVPNNADAPGGVLSIGAINATDSGNDDIAFYSSRGPTNDGRLKPELIGIDGVAVSGAGGFGTAFFGTSASAPHAGAIAALILACNPALRSGEPGDNPAADRAALRNALQTTAFDLGSAGADNTYGFGRIDADAAAAAAGCVSATDTDGDGVPNDTDNCPLDDNPDQANFDASAIGNGPGIPGDDTTVPNADALGDACDLDDDNDGLPDDSDPDPRGDITIDDDNDGNPMAGCFGGTDPSDDGASWDTNCDGRRDGAPADCGSNTADTDGDGLIDAWETCKWGTDPLSTDTDEDGLGDCTEVMDVNGNNIANANDGSFILQAVFHIIGRDGAFDVNGNGLITVADAVFVLRAFFDVSPCI